MPSRAIILHTNDIHGRAEQFGRVLNVIEQTRADNPNTPVIYLDAGDCEDQSNRLSSLSKGTSMHEIIGLAKPAAMTVGNGSILRYGYQVLPNHAQAADCPLLCANLTLPDGKLMPGISDGVVIDCGEFKLGVIGLTAEFKVYEDTFGLKHQDAVETTRLAADELRDRGADVIVVLSHLGFSLADATDDQNLAEVLGSAVDIIIGAHTHNLLANGVRRNSVVIAQAGEYAQHLGRIDVFWDNQAMTVDRVGVIEIDGAMPISPKVSRVEARLQEEMDDFLDEPIGYINTALNHSAMAECGVANLVADALRYYCNADIALSVAGFGFSEGLPKGDIERREIWERCPSTGNPGVVQLTGEQIGLMLLAGLDIERAAETPRALRGAARGLMHISGATIQGDAIVLDATGDPIDPDATYTVAATDGELEHGFGYALEEWRLEPDYEVPTIVRDVVEAYLAAHERLDVPMPRLML